MSGPRQRVTIATVPLVIQPSIDEVATFAPTGSGESVTELPPRAVDRAEGHRRFEVIVDGWRFEAIVESADRAELRERARRGRADQRGSTSTTLRAQIPGRIARLWVTEGEQVEKGQRLLAVEAMKMENEIRAPQAGTVSVIRIEVGGLVERDDELLTVG